MKNKAKVHTTNYYNTLIEIASDTKAEQSKIPEAKAQRSVAAMQYELIKDNPYLFTSDEILFQIFAERNNMEQNELEEARTAFFAKGQPCMRTSPLAKSYGYGIHHNEEGKVSLIPMESERYEELSNDETIKKVKAMRSSK